MTILTQDNMLVNYDYISRVFINTGTIKDDTNGREFQAYEISAIDFVGNDEIRLGLYFSEDAMKNAWNQLTKWLSEKNDYHQLFTMPNVTEAAPVKQRLYAHPDE